MLMAKARRVCRQLHATAGKKMKHSFINYVSFFTNLKLKITFEGNLAGMGDFGVI